MKNSELVSIVFACAVVALLVAFGAPDLITLPIAGLAVVWVAVSVIRTHTTKKKGEA